LARGQRPPVMSPLDTRKASDAMSVADQIRDHQARCLPHLTSLRMLAQGETGTPLPRRVLVEIAGATSAVLTEAEAASRAALTATHASGHDPGYGTFLRVRLDRLAAAADDAITAARAGNRAEMRMHLHRFEALTSAIWTVQQAVCCPAARRASPAA
jgi:hypothetical protein